MKTEIIIKKNSSHYVIKRDSKMEKLPLMYSISKMLKNPVGPRFYIASPNCIFELILLLCLTKLKSAVQEKALIWGKKILGYPK